MASDKISTDRLPEVLPPTASISPVQHKSPDRDMKNKARRRPAEEEKPDDEASAGVEPPEHQLDRMV